MPFDNFYEESDKARRRWWKCFGAAILLFTGYWAAGLLIAPEPKPVEQFVEQTGIIQTPVMITGDKERLRRVNDLCTYLPTPENFHPADKRTLVENPELTLVRYSFKSDRTWDEIMPSFLIWLNANGWKPLSHNQSTFTKDNQTIAFSRILNDSANYEIFCSEKSGASDAAISFTVNDI
jgi:hypothetical protein